MQREYEIMYITRPMDEEKHEAVISKFETLINSNGGFVEKIERWGKKRLAYNINGEDEGLYVLYTFRGIPETVAELDRVMRITDDVLRHMIIRKGA